MFIRIKCFHEAYAAKAIRLLSKITPETLEKALKLMPVFNAKYHIKEEDFQYIPIPSDKISARDIIESYKLLKKPFEFYIKTDDIKQGNQIEELFFNIDWFVLSEIYKHIFEICN